MKRRIRIIIFIIIAVIVILFPVSSLFSYSSVNEYIEKNPSFYQINLINAKGDTAFLYNTFYDPDEEMMVNDWSILAYNGHGWKKLEMINFDYKTEDIYVSKSNYSITKIRVKSTGAYIVYCTTSFFDGDITLIDNYKNEFSKAITNNVMGDRQFQTVAFVIILDEMQEDYALIINGNTMYINQIFKD